jgi:NADH dehydrogenase FAD-containing subunit
MNAEREERGRIPHVVIVGGGFGDLAAAKALKRTPARVTLMIAPTTTCFSLCSTEMVSSKRLYVRAQLGG